MGCRLMRAGLLAFALCGAALPARADQAGVFDLYVLALSWNSTWCAIEGDARGAAQCETGAGHGFTLHGLWPQYEEGWPSYCSTPARGPSDALTAGMVDIMGSSGLAWHQWRKHGVCSGLPAEDYFALSRRAYAAVTVPAVLTQLNRPVRLPAEVVEDTLREANPDLSDSGVVTTCREGRIAELRICLTRDLEPRDCPADMGRDCSLREALFDPIR